MVSSNIELNYSITEVAHELRRLLKGTPLETCCSALPEYLFVVTIPAIEREQVLFHGIVSHELGHPIAERNRLSADILARIPTKEDAIKKCAQSALDQLSPPEEPDVAFPPLIEIIVRSHVTLEVNQRVTKWLGELLSDCIGVLLFGPAYYFAFAHFFLSFIHFDRASRTHPPPRLRLKIMGELLRRKYLFNQEEEKRLLEFCRAWDQSASRKVKFRDPYDQIAVECLDDKATTDLIVQKSIECLESTSVPAYSQESFRRDVKALAPLLVNLIPHGEVGPLGKEKPVSLVSILNVAWYVYLCEFDKFSSGLNESDRTRVRATDKLQRLVMKALEISETSTKWKEASRASGRGKNTESA
jgi:hypothetical protein